MNLTVLCYKKCSTCQKALKWLDANGISYVERPVREENPTLEELREWYGNSGLSLKRFFNTSGNIYKEMSLKDKLPSMSEDEQLALLATDGMLVKRPLVVGDGFVLTGFKEAEWKEKLLKEKNENLNALMENVPGGVICCEYNEELNLLQYSQGFLNMFGYSRGCGA